MDELELKALKNNLIDEINEDLDKITAAGLIYTIPGLNFLFSCMHNHFNETEVYADYESGLFIILGDTIVSPGFPKYFFLVNVNETIGTINCTLIPKMEITKEESRKTLDFLYEEYQPGYKKRDEWYNRFLPKLKEFASQIL